MWNFQHIIFIRRWRYWQIFKSALVYLWEFWWYCYLNMPCITSTRSFPVILILNLNDSDLTILIHGSSLWYCYIICTCSVNYYSYFYKCISITIIIVCIGVSTPLSKTPPLAVLPSPSVNQQTVQASLSRQSPNFNFLGFSRTPPLKVIFFSEPPEYQSFSSLTPSYLLKVT